MTLTDSWGRLLKINDFHLTYDDLGRILRSPGSTGHTRQFTYIPGTDLVDSAVRSDLRDRPVVRVTYYYDHLSRLIGRKDDLGNSSQYFYALPDRPYLVSHVYKPESGQLTTLIYDDIDRLLFADVTGRGSFYVVCDRAASPLLFVEHAHSGPQSGSRIAREISRGAWGEVTYDSDVALGEDLPIGFMGGIVDAAIGIVHLQVRFERSEL